MTDIKLEFLPFSDALLMLGAGFILCLAYLYLLWQSVSSLPNVKRKGVFLFLTGTLRLFLIIFVMLLLSNNNLSRFLYILIGFMCTRSVFLSFTKKGLGKKLRDSEFVKADMKKGRVQTTTRKKSTRRSKR